VRARARQLVVIALAAAAWLSIVPQASAFYPLGVLQTTGKLMEVKWLKDVLDRDGDGDVSGANDGVVLTFESGDDGFTPTEIAEVMAGFEAWENVPTAYAAFTRGQSTEDPLEMEAGIGEGQLDFINYVALEETVDDPGGLSLPYDALGSALVTFTVEDTTIPIEGGEYLVSGGQILEVDVVFNGPAHRPTDLGEQPDVTFEGTAVQLGAIMLGLGPSPLQNFSESIEDGDERNVEDRILNLRDPYNVLRQVGTTPSTYPVIFFYEDGEDVYTDSREDLAPSDIAGISSIYPRGSQDNFFEIIHYARTRTRPGFPSQPVAGALITAWVDHDKNSQTDPKPFASTLTGLYEVQGSQGGKFKLNGLYKVLETSFEAPFYASYVITMEPFEGPDGVPQSYFDTTHGWVFDVTAPTGAMGFDAQFSSETFNRNGNILGAVSTDQGTPLRYDPLSRKVVNADGGPELTLNQMLPLFEPMFGDANIICPYNIVISSLKTQNSATFLRGLRDRVLLQTAVGTAAVDMYYRIAPSVTGFLVSHKIAFELMRGGVQMFEWSVTYYRILVAAFGGLILLLIGSRLRRGRRALVAGLVLLALVPAGSTASAQMVPTSLDEVVKHSDVVVDGKVTRVESRWADDGDRIVTDVVIEIADVEKGRLNKGSRVYLQVPGGQVGSIVTYAHLFPRFKEGEEVMVFLKADQRKSGYYEIASVYRGKLAIKTDEETGEKYIDNKALARELGLAERPDPSDVKEQGKAEAKDANRVPLDKLKQHVAACGKVRRR
jgi:hypothetical protein